LGHKQAEITRLPCSLGDIDMAWQWMARKIGQNYADFVWRAVQNSEDFETFRRDENYTHILEHVTQAQGSDYLDLIRDPVILDICLESEFADTVGSPAVGYYRGRSISPTTLRYGKVLQDIVDAFPNLLDMESIVEIGVGYGGQARIISEYFRRAGRSLRFYALIDLLPVLHLARLYLDHFPLAFPIRYLTKSELGPQADYGLAISNYAFSELRMPIQQDYLRLVLNRSRAGYLTMNTGLTELKSRATEQLAIENLTDLLPRAALLVENPLTSPLNYILVYGDHGVNRPVPLEAIQANSSVAERFFLGVDHYRNGRLADAEACFRDILAAEPRHYDALFHLAQVELQRGQREAAIAYLERAISSNPYTVQHHMTLGVVLRDLGQVDRADAVMRRAEEQFPHEYGPVHELAMSAERRGDWITAGQCWDRACERFPGQWHAFSGSASNSVRQGRIEQAAAILRPAVERFPDLLAPLHDLAKVEEQQQNWQAALRHWTLARERFPQEMSPLIGIAAAQAALGQLDHAEAALTEGLERFPDRIEPYLELARLAERKGASEQALRWWSEARKRFPADARGPAGMAAALIQLDRLDEAEATLIQMSTAFPDQFNPLHDLARLAERRRDWETAARHWAEAQGRFPDVHLPYTAGAVALLELGRSGEAEALLQGAIARFPSEVSVRHGFASLAEMQKDWPLALERWEDICKTFPDSWVSYWGTVRALRALGRADEADALLVRQESRFPNELAALKAA
jgi:putative sugar O-methyltransferase